MISFVFYLFLLLSSVSAKSFVRIAVAIDENSLKDALLLVNSIIETSFHPELLEFYVLACGKDLVSASRLKVEVKSLFDYYFHGVSTFIEPFQLPQDSGFYHQLSSPKKRKHHWNSPIGADMARFYLPEVFPHTDKLLYLDNDIIVSCCVEEIYNTPLNDSELIGIALDDLQWATVTQFQRHYNASHPLTIKYMRQSMVPPDNSPISNNEFLSAVPKYPNDGVILFNVKDYNRAGILKNMNEIAYVNSLQHEHVINLGTQQFTVLTLHNKWKELSTRSNLRHFPSMARGFLMWYYFHGILHYAGMFKPKALCQYSSYKDHNWLRVQSYQPWLINNFHMKQKSQYYENLFVESSLSQSGYFARPLVKISSTNTTTSYTYFYDKCFEHVLPPYDFNHFLIILKSLANASFAEESSTNLVVHIGRLASFTNSTVFLSENFSIPLLQEEANSAALLGFPVYKKWEREALRHSFLGALFDRHGPSLRANIVSLIHHFVIKHSKWNFHAYADMSNKHTREFSDLFSVRGSFEKSVSSIEPIPNNEKEMQQQILQQFESLSNTQSQEVKITSKKRKQATHRKRDFDINFDALCYKEFPDDPFCLHRHLNKMHNRTISYVDILQHVKVKKFKHWDVVGLILDKESVMETMYALNALDMSFLRPKFVVVHIHESSISTIKLGISHIAKFLNRNGYNHAFYTQNFTTSNSLVCDAWIWGSRVNLLEFM